MGSSPLYTNFGARHDTARGQWRDSTQGRTSSVDPSGFCAPPSCTLRATAGMGPAKFGGSGSSNISATLADLCLARAAVS